MIIYTKNFISRHGSHDDYHAFILTNHRADLHYHSKFHLLKNILKLNLPSPLQQLSCRHGTSVIGSTSVNDIFCLGQQFLPIQRLQYVLWNLLTEEFIVVPEYPDNGFLETVFHGFGYDQLRDDFKIIQFISFEDSSSYPAGFFEIYSLKSNSWRMIDMEKDLYHQDHAFITRAFNGLKVYLDGACHWLLSGYINNKDQDGALSLLSFNLSDEVFLTTPIGVEHFSPYIPLHHWMVLNGSMTLISNYHHDIVFHMSILDELGVTESWIKLNIYGPLPSI
ncbi:unnamed protein product [Trifolium pratense]|uniref:Uncharacterized protein n=1 Tax=Trifolium pratense TaxID=57577 RepID=A0ACB0LFW3_TRIPR|nr:unnamed protein product [Trifolium pratense]